MHSSISLEFCCGQKVISQTQINATAVITPVPLLFLLLSVAIYEGEMAENAAKAADGGHWTVAQVVATFLKVNYILQIRVRIGGNLSLSCT